MRVSRSLVRYHGGKFLLAPWIIQHLPKHRVYVEPYGGGASVLLRKPRSYAEIYNDLDGEIVNLFRVVRDRGEELRMKLEMTPYAREEYAGSFAETDDVMEQARRTVIRSFMGFGSNALCRAIKSGFRANSNRSGTTPAHDWRNYPDALLTLIERLRGVVIENRNALQVLMAHDNEQTVHYVDPPYVHSTRSNKIHGHHGYNHEMTDDQHRELAEVLHSLKGSVVLSGYHSALYDDLYADWALAEKHTTADGARPRIEVLWLSPNCRIGQQGLFA